MKKFLLMLGAVALFTACSDDGGSGSGNINYEEGYKYLTNLNVSDAKMIYQKSSATRATGDDSYYKLDLSGNEVKLSIKGEDGQDHNIGIHKVLKLSDKVLLVNPIAQDIIDLFYKPEPDGLGISVGWGSTEYLSIVDVQTEKIYRWPKEIDVYLGDGSLKTILDNQGNIYIASSSNSNYPEYRQIYKLNVSDFTMQKMLPDEVRCNGFTVTDNGFVVYWSGQEQQQNCRVKCPGGRIYPISDIYTFIFNGNLYSIRNNAIIQYKTVGNNDLEEKTICTISDEQFNGYWRFLPNHVRKTMVLNEYYEFDGEKCTQLDKQINIGDIRTNKAWYNRSNTTFSKIAMKDYQESQFQILDYEIQSLSANSESSNITFTGFRYSDGVNVVGTITETDEVVIDNVAENGNKIINLISLN
ncbi:hypothetical protein [Bacteroides uniformis]|jgi:hypothetical protein|uniref:hypothetical protein n=1 Tax=Bacteroides uniformis TaxID=820 RepID=UPI001AA11984|nr:hypothetical protein [Bacteroides uniformis]MBO1692748.1 hypothetical protein [Bacteroides uniformis]